MVFVAEERPFHRDGFATAKLRRPIIVLTTETWWQKSDHSAVQFKLFLRAIRRWLTLAAKRLTKHSGVQWRVSLLRAVNAVLKLRIHDATGCTTGCCFCWRDLDLDTMTLNPRRDNHSLVMYLHTKKQVAGSWQAEHSAEFWRIASIARRWWRREN